MKIFNTRILLTLTIIWNLHICSQSVTPIIFEEATTVIDLEERSRRKFDNAVIVDLD